MMQSLPGLFKNTKRALQKSPDDLACVTAFSLGELVDNLRLVKDGEVTFDEFFSHYVFDSQQTDLADSVKPDDFVCMADKVEDVD